MYSYTSLIRDIVHFVRPYRWRFLFASCVRLSSDLMRLYATYALAHLLAALGKYVVGESVSTIWFLLTMWVLAFLFVITTNHIGKYFCYYVAERVKLDSQLFAFRHLALLDIAWHEKENTGNKLKRVENGGEGLEKLLRIWIDNVIEIGVNFVGMILVIAFTDLTIAGILVLFLVTYLFVNIPLARHASAAAQKVNQLEEDYSGLAFEIMNNIRTVKVMHLFANLFHRLDASGKRAFSAVVIRIRRFRLQSWVRSAWAYMFRVAIIVFIAFGIFQGEYTLSFLLLFDLYFANLRSSVEELSAISQDITIARYHIARLKTILEEKVAIDSEVGKKEIPSGWNKISLRKVSFSYGNHRVLQNISFDIARGEKIGIVGLSGVGKSTLFKLLLKEYENFTGDILFDDVPLRTIKKSSYFTRAAVVLQDTEVFNFSLRDNITISGEEGDEKRLAQAIEVAHVKDFMRKLPNGLDTLIGEKGVKLSGGEKQRLGIARAIFKQPDILFLDEATSHLDVESEEKIQDSLHQFFKDVTAIVIAHRLTTIQEMDRILLMEDGEIRESGSFKALYKKRGRFYELWEKQKL